MAVMRGRSIMFAVACSALAAGCSFGPLARLSFGPDASPDGHGSTTEVPDLTERSTCASAASAVNRSMSSETGGGQALQVVVPPTAILDLVDGVVTAATTNTGCAPRPGDTVFGRYPDGTIVELPEWDDDVIWVGDFTHAGVAVTQQH